MFRAFLLLTLLSLPTPVLAQHLVWLSNVTESVDEGGTINFTVERFGISQVDLDVKVDIVPASPIAGFNIISGGDDTDGAEVTVTIPGGDLSASGSIGTINNSIVNVDVTITVSIDDTPTEYSTPSNHPGSLSGESELLESATTTVRNGTDVYVTGVRLPSPKHVSDTITEGETITLQFMRCVGLANSEVIRSCDDVVTQRAGAITPPALTQAIIVGGTGDFASGLLPLSVSFEAGSFSKTVEIETDDDSIDEYDGSLIFRTFANSTLENRYVSITLRDNDVSTVALSLSDASIAEDGGVATVRASVSHPSDEPTTVTVSVSPDSPAVAGDYESSANQVLTIAAGQIVSTGTVTITGVDNDVDAADKTVKVQGAASNTIGISGPADVTLTLEDDDTRGVTVSKTSLDIDEGDDGTYTVVLDSEPTASVTVTPERGANLSSISGVLTFTTANWDTAQTVTVGTAHDLDGITETTVVRNVVSGGDYETVMAASVAVTVHDDEKPATGVILEVAPRRVGEGAGATTVRVGARLNGLPRSEATPVAVTVGSGTATSGTDFTAVAGFSISIPANTQSHIGTFTLTPTQDTVDEPDETVTVGGTTTVSGFSVTGTTVGIRDDDASPTVTLSLSDTSIAEDGGVATVTASLSHASSVATTVTVSVSPDSPASDYEISANQVLTIAAGRTASTGTVTITGVDNDVDTADKTIKVQGTAGNTVGASGPADVTLTLEDDDTRGVTVSKSDLDIDEGDNGSYTVVLNSQPTARVTVRVSRTSGSTDVTVSRALRLRFTTASWDRAQTVRVRSAQDSDAIDDTAVIGHAVSGGDYGTVRAASVAVTVDDDDTASSGVTLTVSPGSVSEGAGATTVTVTASLNGGTRSEATPVAVTVGSGTATSGTDFAAVTGFTISIPANTRSHTGTFTLTPTQDTVDEPNETVTVGGTTTVSGLSVTGTTVGITDDDVPASTGVILAVSPRAVSEGAIPPTVTVTARLNGATRGEATPVAVTVGSGTATSGVDFAPVAGFTVSIPAGSLTVAGTFTLTPTRDMMDEPDEVLTVGGTTTVPGLSVTGTTVAILDADPPPTATLSLSDTSIAEDGGVTTVTASLSYTSHEATVVFVSVSVSGSLAVSSDYEISANKVLTIAAGQTASTGTVTVTGVNNDVDTEDKTVQVTGFALVGLQTSAAVPAALTLEDDDTRGVTVSTTALDIDEGDDGTYTVVLDSKPTGQVTVTPSRTSGSTDVTVSGALTFRPTNWDTAQTVTVSAAQDRDGLDDDTAVIGHAVSGGDYGSVAAASVDVTVQDDDGPSTGVILSVSPRRVSEGAGATTVTVGARLNGLTRSEATPVAVTVGSGTATSGTDFAAVAGFMVSIPAGSFTTSGTFTLTPTQDTVDEPDETVTVDGTTTVPGFTVMSRSLPIIDDDASPTVTLSLSDASIAEDGGVATVTASLSHASSEATTVTVSVSPDSPAVAGDYEISANQALTIAAGRTASTGTVAVTGVNNGVIAANKTVRVQGTAVNTVGITGPADVTLTLEDDDTRGVTVSTMSLDIDEGDDGTYTVVLTSQPTGQVTVTPSRSSGDADVTVSGALTFTPVNWDTARTVTVSAAQDPDAIDDTAVLGHTVSGGDYGSVAAASVDVTVDDDETASSGATLTVSPESVSEGAAATTVTVTARLNGGTRSEATPVAVTVGSGTATSGTDFAAVTGFSISIPANTRSHTGTFTLTPTQDTVDEPDETVTVGGTTTVSGFSVTGTTVGITDDDASPTVTLSLSDASIAEAGGVATVTASLSHASSEATTVTVSVSPDSPAVAGDYGISANQALTIAAGQTASTGTVTVTGVNNDVDTADKTVKVQGTAGNTVGASGPADVTLTLEDDDTRGVTVSKSDLDIAEDGSGTYTVVLGSEPTGSVTVTPSRTSGSTDVTVSGALTFTTADWDTAQTVTVSAAQDPDAIDDTAVLGHAVRGGDYGSVVAASVDVTVDDDETASTGVTLSVSPDSVSEGASATTVTVTARLNGGTRGDATPVAVTVGSGTATSGTDFAAVTGFSISIPANTQSHTGTFTLTPTQDTVDEPDETVTVGGTTTVSGFAVTGTTVEIADDDASPTVTLSLSDASITEDAGSTTVTASLSHASSVATTVTVSVSPDSPAVAGDYEISANQALAIAAGRTASTGTVTVTGVDNDVDTADKTVRVKGAASNTVGASGPADVTLTLEDDDTRGVTVSKSDLDIAEGDDGSYTVVLTSQPTGQVTVTPSRSSGDADVTVSGALTFTTVNWDTARTVTVSAAQDPDAVDDTAAIGHVVSGGDYGSVAAASVDVTVDDDETASSGVTLSVSPGSVSEGASATTMTVTASLNGGTRGDATPVAVTVGSGTAASGTDFGAVAGFSISIPANTRSRTGTFTLTPTQDTVDEPDETVTVGGTTTVSGFAVTGTTVEIADDDASPTVTLSLSDASIAEDGGVATVTASLSHASSVATTVTVSVSPDSPAVAGDYEISANQALTIAAGRTASTGTVTVTGVNNDVDTADKTVKVQGAASNTVGASGPADVTLTLEDDDTRGVTVSKSDLDIDEGDDGTYTVVLASKPTGQVTVTPSRSSGDADVTVSGALTFTPANWDTARTVTVSAAQDLDAIDDTAVLGHAVSGGDYGSVAAASVDVTVDDDETASSGVTLSVSPESVSEGASATTVTVTASLNGGTRGDATPVAVTVGSGTATSGTDFTAVAGFSISIPANTRSRTGPFTLTPTQDTVDEPDETVTVGGTTTVSGFAVTGTTVEIADDDASPTVTLSLSDASIAEDAGSTTVTISTGSGPTFGAAQTITLTLSGTAMETDDYTISSTSLTLAAGAASVTATITAVQDIIDDDAETVIVTASNGGDSIGSQTITIADDDDAPALSLSVSSGTIAEDGETSSTVTVGTGAGAVFETEQTIALTLTGTATRTDDYTISGESLTLAAGATSVTATVTAVDDNFDDDAETVLIDAAIGQTAVGTQQSIAIADDDAAPVLSVTVNNASVAEAAGTSTVTVSTGSGSTFTTDRTITVTLGGTATVGDDYTLGLTSLTLPAGESDDPSEIATAITAVQDRIDDDAETVVVNAALGSGSSATAIGSATVTIADDDGTPEIAFTVSDASISEAGGTSTVTVSTGNGSTFATAQTFPLALVPDTATEGADFTLLSKSLTLPAGTGTTASSIATTVTAVQDRIDEADETILIDVIVPGGGGFAAPRQKITITDDDAAPVLFLDVSSATIAEAAGTSIVTVSTGTGSTFVTDQAIALTLGGTATEVDDYTIGSTSLTLPAGAGTTASEIATPITAVDDDFFEGVTHEQLTVAGTHGGASFGATRSVTITENEAAPKLTVSFTDDSISENGGSTAVTASVSPRTVDAFTATFAATPDAPATAADYDLTGTVSFAALSATPTGTVTITANNNRVDRPDKSVSVTATGSQSYFRATDAATLTIEDEDAAPAPVLEVSDASIAENAGVATVTVTTGGGSTFPEAMTVTLAMTGAAGENADYTILSKSLTLPAGSGLDISMITTTVTGVDDIIDDDAEDILIDAAIGASAVGTRQTVTVDDDDAAPVLEISLSDASIAENGGTSTLTVGTGTGSTFAADQAIELSLSGTATAANDYSLDTTLTLPAGVGVNASSVTATVTGVDDIIDDDAETILIDGTRSGTGFGAQQTVTIADDDAAPVLVFTALPASIAENGGVSTVTVGTGTGSTYATEQTITLSLADTGTAIEGADYTIGARSLTLPAGVGSSASSVETAVTGLDDGLFEGEADQTVLVTATHAGTPVGSARTVAVVDDEANSQVVLTLDPNSIGESDVQGTPGRDHISQIAATVSPPAEHAFVVDLEIRPNAPATAADFTTALPVPTYGLLDFAAGATQSTGLAFITAVDNEVDAPDKTLTVSGSVSGFDPVALTLQPARTTGILPSAPALLTIQDDDESANAVTLSVDVTSVAEDAGAIPVEVTATLASGSRESAVAVTVTVGSGTGDAGAQAGADFDEVAPFTIDIPAGDESASASFSLTPLEDRIDEPDEALSVTGATDDALVGVPDAVAIAISDNDDAPELTLEVEPPTIAEDGGAATVTVSTGAGSTFADSRTVALTVSGTASTGVDYTIGSRSLTLPEGAGTAASVATTTLTALDDNIDDDAETVVIGALLDGEAIGAAQTVTIADDDGSPQVTLVLTPATIAEDGGVSTVTATVSPASATAFTVTVAIAPVAPAVAGDFEQSGTALSFAQGASSSTGSVTIAAVDNAADTPNRQVSVSGTVSSAGVSAPAPATLTILDDDTEAVLTLAVDTLTIAEDGGVATVTVTTGTGSTFDSAQAITLVFGGTATPGEDYVVSATELRLPANASSVTTTVTGLNDALFEGEETVLVSGLHDGGAFGVEQAIAIADDETAPAVTLVLTPDSIAEDGGTTTVTATVSSALPEPFTLTVAVEPNAPAVAEDFALSGETLTFEAGAAASTGEVTIAAVDNDVDAADKTLRVSGAVSRGDVAAPEVATLTIEDDDEASSTVTLSVSPERIEEGAPATPIEVTASFDSGVRDVDTVISLSVGGGEAAATPGVDYGPVADFSLTIPANGTSATATFMLAPLEDRIDEPDEAVTLTGTAGSAGIGVPEAVAVAIADNDDAPELTLEVQPATIEENGGRATVTVTTGEGSTFAHERIVELSVAGTATVGEDYTIAARTLTLPAGAASGTSSATVTLTGLDDGIAEADETVVIGGTVDGAAFGTHQTVTITDDDDAEPPAITLVLTPASIGENAGVSTVTATVTPASSEAFTVTVAAAAVEPAVAGDFTLSGATLSFAAAATQSTGEVTIAAVDNDEDAPDKTVTVSGTVSLEGVTAPPDAALTITDDDVTEPPVDTPALALVLSPASIGENAGASTVTATVTPASSEAFTVTVAAAAVEPAVAGDFTLSGATLSFAAAATQSTGEVTIAAVDNDEDAPDKTVTVSGTVSLEGVTAPPDATLTITDDDEAVVEPPPVERGVDISSATPTIVEGDETGGSYSVKLTAEPSEDVTVTVSAPAGSGLTVEPARLTFTAADWQTAQNVTVTAAVVVDDAGDRTVTLTHAAAGAGYENVAVADVTVTVTDRIDPELPAVSIADARGREADGQLVFDLTLNRAAQQPVSVQYATRDGTAKAAEDYEAGAGTATIAAGETGARIVVPLHIDLFSEPDETFALMLSRADGARLADAQATGTIEDAAEDGAASQQWLARFGRVAGGQVMAVIGDQIASNRGGESQVTLAGTRLTGGGANPFGAPTAGLGASGGTPGAGFGASGAGFGPTVTRTMSGRELLANSAFLLNAGPGGGNGVAVWGRGAYTRFDNLGEGIQTGGDAVTATVGVDWACARCLLGIALSHTAVDAAYGAAGEETGELESTVTGLYPYFGAQLTERFSVWGLVGQGEGELIATPTEGRAVQVDMESGLAGLGARGEIVVADNGFTLAVKTDALVARTSTGQAEGILEAEGEYRRVRLGLESAWLRELGENASLRSSLEVAAREDAGDGLDGLGVEVAGALKFIDVAPGLSLDLGVRGLVSHESEDFEEWGVSGGFRYDPQPDSAAGPRVSLSHSRGPAGSGGLQQALWQNNQSRPLAPSPGRSDGQPDGQLSAEFAYGFDAFGALGVPWARVGTTGAGKEYRLGYSLLTHRGTPSLELGQSAFAREYRMGWEFSLRCRAQVAVEVLHTAPALGEKADTGFQIKFRSVAPGGGSGGAWCAR